MAKFPEAMVRNSSNKFVCKKCKTVIKSDMLKVLSGKATCRRCNSHKLRTPRKK